MPVTPEQFRYLRYRVISRPFKFNIAETCVCFDTKTEYTVSVSLLYVIDAPQKCIFMHLSGEIGTWELGTRVQQLWGEPAFNPYFARLIQASDVIKWAAETSLLRAIATDVRVKSPSKVAMVAQAEPVISEFKLYVESLTGVPARVFDRLQEAAEWLGIRLPEPWPPQA